METQGPPGLAIRSRNPYLKIGHHDHQEHHQELDHDDHQSWPPHEATLPPSDGNRCLCLHSLVTLRHKINDGDKILIKNMLLVKIIIIDLRPRSPQGPLAQRALQTNEHRIVPLTFKRSLLSGSE